MHRAVTATMALLLGARRLEQGLEVAVVSDATAAAQHPELGDGYAAALTSFRCIAGAALPTAETVEALATGT